MVGGVGEWWGGCEEETKWLDGVESRMADLRPLAGSVTIIKTQRDENEVQEREREGGRERERGREEEREGEGEGERYLSWKRPELLLFPLFLLETEGGG